MKVTTKRRHIPELDGLRGIAAIAVFFHHLSFASIDRVSKLWDPAIRFIISLSHYGLYGVDMFFVLSGYLITTILLQDRTSADYYSDFYWKRALRILPLYLISLFVSWFWFKSSATGGLILGLFFIANFAGLFHVALTGPYWTLAIEEQFYLVWPQFVRRWTVGRLETLAWAIVIGEPVLRLIDTAFGHYNFLYTCFRCDGLALGALLACQRYRVSGTSSAKQGLRRHASLAGTLLVSCSFLALTIKMMDSPRYTMQGSALFLSAINICFYCVIRLSVKNSGSIWLAVLRTSVLVFFGEISYCIYMSHTYVMRTYDAWRGPVMNGNAAAYWIRIAAVFGGTIAVSVISRHTIELPFISLRKYVLHKSKPSETLHYSGN